MDFTTFTMPEWATSEEAQAFFTGFFVGSVVMGFRAALRWVKRAGSDGGDS